MSKLDTISNSTGIINKIVELYEKYGFKKILKAILCAVAIGYICFFALNPTYFLDRWNEKQAEKHTKEITQRFELTNNINNEIERIKDKLGADRVFVIEFHNSVKSIEGFPFAFGSMNFETCQDSVMYVSDEYTNFNLSKYKMISHIYNNSVFFGSVDEVKPIDNRLYLKFLSNDAKEIGLITIEGTKNPIGILGITYTSEENRDWSKIRATLRQESVRIALLYSN